MLRVVFMGSPEFAVPSLQALIDSNHEVVAVYSQPPRPAGRGHKERKTPVHELADQHGIPVFTPTKLTDDDAARIQSFNPDVICVAAYGMLLRENVLNIAPCVNVHPSALPRWRGAAPIQYTILNGDTHTDMCIMQMEKGLDSGPVYKRVPYTIGADETAGDLHDKMAVEGGKHLVDVLNNWPVEPIPQNENGMTYANKFKPEDLPQIRTLDFSKPAQEVHNQIRGLSPWPGATAKLSEDELKVLRSTLVKRTGTAGEVLEASSQHGVVVACGEGAIRLQSIQRPGKKAMPDTELIKGYPALKAGAFLK